MEPSEELKVRDYDPARDLEGLCQTFSGAFHKSFWPIIDEADPDLVHQMMRGILEVSPQSLVAVTAKGEVVGMILGYTGLKLRGPFRGGFIFSGWTFRGLMLNQFHASSRARRFVLELARAFAPVLISGIPSSRPACEVNVFAVNPDFQGLGVGKRLMDEFVREAQTAGAKKVFLVTDTTLSWQFYPAYGFEQTKSAPVPGAYRASLPEEAAGVTAFVYSLDLSR